MKLSVSYHQVDHSPALNEFIEGKLERLEEHFKQNLEVEWVIEKENRDFICHVKFKHRDHHDFVHAKSDDVHVCVDEAIKRLKRQLSNHEHK